ncbi:Zn-dependent hydrolase [Bacillus pseudomycoides]|uniref:MBL fold metallo-hydrolase n=1 Tax=Bacillus TaxID=1386 RepID=UPI00035E0662|nr:MULTISPECIES: MBL fold metallo-hydrolase [Bacillus]AIK38765.1 metallo-beta-lactamase superfamily protein [Bacillus pseudomycoides]AJI17772.1 beta-lactamase superfamily domain protein [Bacillus pseudomycoides]MEB3052550.1 MBL fold metallo-hydrolase [Bacillus pseudomycoides]PDY01725.1 Zn-dependent hydrolase [Bacillus pseudomycoides]PEB38498.1 Zn-dependent hydrolase [Bacillus pseudomycoides]
MQKLKRISNRVLYLPPYQETDRPILAAVKGEEKTLLIDAGNSSKHARLFLEQLDTYDIKEEWLILTHSDWDHIFGMHEMQMPIISHYKTYNKIKQLQNLSWEDKYLDQRVKEGLEIPFCADAIKKELGNQREIILPLPDITFDKKMTLNLGGVTCAIEHVGGDHADDSTVIYIQEEKVLFLGDCMYANLYSKKWSYTIENTLQLIEQIEKYDAEIFVLSHHEAPLTKEEFQLELKFLKTTALLTKKYEGSSEAIVKEMSKSLQRSLTEDEIETITFFVNGFSE